jgi:DNA (cytosine-5)-methyltransferase 3A
LKLNILSLFDGMSCGQIALERAGIKVNKYFASEIDKYAIKVTQKNYPQTIQLGDVQNWKSWNLPKIDLLIGGSPCQGFSFAGKQLNFNDPRSKLFFEYVEILNFLKKKNPKIKFLLENVKMKQEFQDVISEYLKITPIEINSSLVSAQSRKRLYWTNIHGIEQPEDKKIFLKDILENFDIQNSSLIKEKSNTVRSSGRGSGREDRHEWGYIYVKTIPHGCLVGCGGATLKNQIIADNIESQLNIEKDGEHNFVASDHPHKLNGLIQVGMAENINGYDIVKRVYSINGKSPSLTTMQGGHREPKIALNDIYYRKLTPLECERLQTVPDNYTSIVSNSQRYKMLGNGWTVDVIKHIFSYLLMK